MTAATRSLRALLEELIDYAGLFPPARLDMAPAVREYADRLAGPDAWVLGRFIVPSARLEELEGAASTLLPRVGAAAPWRLSVLGGPDAAHDAEQVWAFNERHAHTAIGRAVIDTVEVKASDVATLERLVRSVPDGITTYVEIPAAGDIADLVSALGNLKARAKVRTGGVTPDAFPSPADLARFIHLCTGLGVPFKATAGLHHPLRGEYPLTYDADSPRATMYGFLNVFLATAFAQQGLGLDDVRAALEERDPAAFAFDEEGVTWRGRRAGIDDLAALRTRGAAAFGSCSVAEPIDELRALGLL